MVHGPPKTNLDLGLNDPGLNDLSLRINRVSRSVVSWRVSPWQSSVAGLRDDGVPSNSLAGQHVDGPRQSRLLRFSIPVKQRHDPWTMAMIGTTSGDARRSKTWLGVDLRQQLLRGNKGLFCWLRISALAAAGQCTYTKAPEVLDFGSEVTQQRTNSKGSWSSWLDEDFGKG